jgi:hypothetical protein
MRPETYTYLSAIEVCFKSRRLRIEIMYAGSIYENQIETFSGAKKQRIDSSYMHFLQH